MKTDSLSLLHLLDRYRSLSKSDILGRLESVERGIRNVDGEEVIALRADPPVIAEAKTVVADLGKGLLVTLVALVVDGVVELLDFLVELSNDAS